MSLSKFDWTLIGRDSWREVFSWLSFSERNKVRAVCKQWNELIVTFDRFWPLGSEMYRKVLSNVVYGKYTEKRVEIEPLYYRFMYSDLGVICSILDSDGFMSDLGFKIYCKDTLQVIFHYKELFKRIHASGDYIIIADDLAYYLLSFEKTLNPKQPLILKQKTQLLEKSKDDIIACIFEYPFVCFNLRHRKGDIVIDLRTGKDILKENKIFPFRVHKLKNNYLVLRSFSCDTTYVIYDILNMKKTPFTITVKEGSIVSIVETTLIVQYYESDDTMIDCFNLHNHKKTTFQIDSSGRVWTDQKFVIVDTISETHIYRWNFNYTKLLPWNISSEKMFTVDCFHSSLPFILFRIQHSGLAIYFKNGNKRNIDLPGFYDSVFGDQKSRLYLHYKEAEKYYLKLIDFSVSE